MKIASHKIEKQTIFDIAPTGRILSVGVMFFYMECRIICLEKV